MKRRKKNFVKQVQRNNYKYIVPILRIILLKNGEKKNFDSMILEQEKNKNKILIFNFGINKYFTLLLTLFSILFVMYNIIIDNISNVCFNLTIYIYTIITYSISNPLDRHERSNPVAVKNFLQTSSTLRTIQNSLTKLVSSRTEFNSCRKFTQN